jgi:hypothetical protein
MMNGYKDVMPVNGIIKLTHEREQPGIKRCKVTKTANKDF